MKLPELFYKIAYLCESLLRQVTNLPIGIKHPMGDFTLLLCGWDWSDVSGSDPIFAGRIQYNERTGNFKAARAYFPRPPQVINHRVIAIGDCLPDFYREYNKLSCQQDVLDFEPLRILQKIAESSDIRTIGGSVQAVKIYKHYNSLPLLIDRSEVGRFLYGRKLFDWEEVAMESTTLKLDL